MKALILSLALLGCSGKTASAPAGGASSPASGCDPGAPLAGATYDIAKSKFAFGGTPTKTVDAHFTRYVGPDGVVAISPNGAALGSLNGGAPEQNLPEWTNDGAALQAHVKDYFVSMGVDPCQIGSSNVLGGGSGGSGGPGPSFSVGELNRAVDGIPVGESLAHAQFKQGDVTISEGFYWPAIPADVVTAARALRDRLNDPGELAAYKSKLPEGARGDGRVVIQHSTFTASGPFQAVACWSTLVGGSSGSTQCFDANGVAVPLMM